MIVWVFLKLYLFCVSDPVIPSRWIADTLRSFQTKHIHNPKRPSLNHSNHQSSNIKVLYTSVLKCIPCRVVLKKYLNLVWFTFTRAKVSQFDTISWNQYILRFYVPMEDTLGVYIFDWFDEFEHVVLNFLWMQIFISNEALV